MFITKSNEAKIHPVLQTLSISYPQQGLVASKLCPIIDVGEENENGQYFTFDKANIQGGIECLRAYGAQAGTYDWTLSPTSYHCDEYSLEKPIDWREFKQWANYMDLAKITQEITLEILLLQYEVRVATLLTSTANYASSSYYTTLSGTSQWDDYVNSDPEADIETAREQVALGGAEPNAVAIPVNVWRKIRRHPAIRALIKETSNAELTEDGFPKKLFGLDAYYPGSRQNTAMPGASESISRVWSDYVWVGVVNPRPSKRTISFAYTLQAQGTKIETYEDAKRKSDVIRVQQGIQVEKVVANTAGYLIADVLA